MIDPGFLAAVETLRHPGMGTENAAPLLYSLVRMLRPRRAMEVGLGYTTPFLLRALADAEADWRRDLEVLQGRVADSARRGTLRPDPFRDDYAPKLIAIDDFSIAESNATRVQAMAGGLGLAGRLVALDGDFRDQVAAVATHAPLDFVWFDCGGPPEYADFLRLFWDLIDPEGGVLALHFTHGLGRTGGEDPPRLELMPGRVLAHIRAQIDRNVELLSLVEPHKHRQGSVTLLRRVPAAENSGVADRGTPEPDFLLSPPGEQGASSERRS